MIRTRTALTALALSMALGISIPALAVEGESCGRFGAVSLAKIFDDFVPCGADVRRPLFTRKEALACSTHDGALEARNAISRGWHLVASAGIRLRAGDRIGMPVTPEHFGCKIYGDGVPASHPTLVTSNGNYLTDLGWVSGMDMRN